MSLKYNGKNIPLARDLRTNATKQENHLWYDFLAVYPVRFQRQKAIGNFIVDFYCHAAELVIEIDGSQHDEPSAKHHDNLRTQELEKLGLEVIRFKNFDIDQNFNGVCTEIDRTVKKRISKI